MGIYTQMAEIESIPLGKSARQNSQPYEQVGEQLPLLAGGFSAAYYRMGKKPRRRCPDTLKPKFLEQYRRVDLAEPERTHCANNESIAP